MGSGRDNITEADARAVLQAWGKTPTRIEPVVSGHINQTYRIDCAGEVFALQWINPIFDPAIHQDIQEITVLLDRIGVPVPRLIPAGKQLFHKDPGGGVWRLMTWIEGEVALRADSPERCREAGRLLGRFHRCLWNSDHQFRAARLGVHDTLSHLLKLRKALESHVEHPSFGEVWQLADEILKESELLRLPGNLPMRVVHGDPKISNFVFDPQGRAVGLIDLDTLARMPIPVELGDAFRSWCSPQGEEEESRFVLSHFKAGLEGWLESVGDRPYPEELAAIPPTVEVIALELAARFCADALEENYFRWDPDRYPTASAHNLARTRSQLALARSVRSQLPDMRRILDDFATD